MDTTAELKARKWLAEQLAWEHRLDELRRAARIAGVEPTVAARQDQAA